MMNTETFHNALSGMMMTFYAMMPVAVSYLFFTN